mmetsp:Transcript_71953/g.153833  ORF Transcript_71953/g.153833 Transcript_71953/m.153833 type:complete len:204 (+) Transcript_71953:177-788(+)
MVPVREMQQGHILGPSLLEAVAHCATGLNFELAAQDYSRCMLVESLLVGGSNYVSQSHPADVFLVQAPGGVEVEGVAHEAAGFVEDVDTELDIPSVHEAPNARLHFCNALESVRMRDRRCEAARILARYISHPAVNGKQDLPMVGSPDLDVHAKEALSHSHIVVRSRLYRTQLELRHRVRDVTSHAIGAQACVIDLVGSAVGH